MKFSRIFWAIWVSAALALLTACGGGSSSPGSNMISGTVTQSGVPVADVTVTLAGSTTAPTTMTDTSGNYSFTGVANGNYTVTPSKSGLAFSPTSSVVTMSGPNITGTDFNATAAGTTFSISGTVSGATGATLTLSGANTGAVNAGTGGAYTLTGLAPGSYTVTPSLSGYTFSPASVPVTLTNANSTANNFTATANPASFSQADLTGTWRVNMLTAGNDYGWLRATGTADATGMLTVSSFLDSSGNTAPGAGTLQWTINSSGVVSESGTNGSSDAHMTMASNKNFIARTGSDGSSQLRIAQKVVPGTVYSNADVFNKTFVYHSLRVGAQTEWRHGVGTTDNSGAINISSDTRPGGTTSPGAQGTISVDSNGVVTLSSDPSFSGFLSDDKKTVVGTLTDNGRYMLIIFQLTGQTYTAGAVPVGTAAMHMLAVGASPAPMWIHATISTASGGVMTFRDWVSNNSGSTAPTTPNTGSIDTAGTVSLLEDATFHGQVSSDGKFVVGTRTLGNGVYSLQVTTK